MQFPMFKSYLDVEENEDNSVTVVDFLHPSVSYTLPLEMYHFASNNSAGTGKSESCPAFKSVGEAFWNCILYDSV